VILHTTDPAASATYEPAPRPWRFLIALSGFLAELFSACAWLGMFGWALGEVVSDRYAWSQWLEWIPTIFTLIGALVCLAAASGAAALRSGLQSATITGSTDSLLQSLGSIAKPTSSEQLAENVGNTTLKQRPRRLRFFHRARWFAWSIVLVYFVISETPFYKPTPEPPAFNQDSFRLVYWNSGGEEQPGWDRAIGALNPDILILNGLHSSAGTPGLQALLDSNASVIVNERFVVISKRPIVRWGATTLALPKGEGLDPRQTGGHRPWIDRGRALFFQFLCPTTDLNGLASPPPTLRTAWIIDLPSDLSLSRAQVTARANEIITNFPSKAYIKDSRGAWIPEEIRTAMLGFPRPDIITGDFNIPRGSWSLDRLVAHLDSESGTHTSSRSLNAYHQAARRFSATWPRPRPFLHLDQTFLAPALRAWSYNLKDPGSAEHLAQAVDITVR